METSACGPHWRQGPEGMMGCCQESLMVAECVFQQEHMCAARAEGAGVSSGECVKGSQGNVLSISYVLCSWSSPPFPRHCPGAPGCGCPGFG